MCRVPEPPASPCRDASALDPSEAGLAEAGVIACACMKAGQLRRSRAARIAKEGQGEAPAEKLPRGCHARVRDYSGAPRSRPCLPRKPSGMPSDPDLAAPAASPTQQAWAEVGRSVLAVPQQGCFRAHEACRGCFGSQEVGAGIQEEAESQGEGPAFHHAVPSASFHEAVSSFQMDLH